VGSCARRWATGRAFERMAGRRGDRALPGRVAVPARAERAGGLALSDADPARALRYLQAALALTGEPPDGQTLSNMGWLPPDDDAASAITYEQQALEARRRGRPPRQARAHIRLGWPSTPQDGLRGAGPAGLRWG